MVKLARKFLSENPGDIWMLFYTHINKHTRRSESIDAAINSATPIALEQLF